MTTAAALIREATGELRHAGVADPGGDARVLFRWAAGVSAAGLIAVERDPVARDVADRFRLGLNERLRRRPVSQIIGGRLFWGRWFQVTGDVLDPRPESETLVAAALDGPAPDRVLDLGVGSGCLLLSVLAERPGASGVGVDQSAAALAVARENAEQLGMAARVRFVEGDWLDAVSDAYDLILCNPPYIAEAEMSGLEPEVTLWEPPAALTPGGDGLQAYRDIAPGLAATLNPGGRAVFEFGAGQAAAIREIFLNAGLTPGEPLADLDGRDRCLIVSKPK